MRWTPNSLPLLLAAAACGAPQRIPQPTLSAGGVEEPVTRTITAALEADRLMAGADSLWDPDAMVIADGEMRYAPPRFAGIEPGGEVAITSSRLEVRQSLVWVYLEYRWISVKDGLAREGKATILLTPHVGAAGWRIVHSHSSMAQD